MQKKGGDGYLQIYSASIKPIFIDGVPKKTLGAGQVSYRKVETQCLRLYCIACVSTVLHKVGTDRSSDWWKCNPRTYFLSSYIASFIDSSCGSARDSLSLDLTVTLDYTLAAGIF